MLESITSPSCSYVPQTVSVKNVLAAGSRWYNELGSVMTVTAVDIADGNFAGKYCSGVGKAVNNYTLLGRFDSDGQSLGWVVSYKNQFLNAHSTAGWSGQLQMDPSTSQPVILTTWLLTTETQPQNNWNSTNVGFDKFTTTPQNHTLKACYTN